MVEAQCFPILLFWRGDPGCAQVSQVVQTCLDLKGLYSPHEKVAWEPLFDRKKGLPGHLLQCEKTYPLVLQASI